MRDVVRDVGTVLPAGWMDRDEGHWLMDSWIELRKSCFFEDFEEFWVDLYKRTLFFLMGFSSFMCFWTQGLWPN